jgi:excisionase family DNA binding protein
MEINVDGEVYKFYSVEEVAKLLGVAVSGVRLYIRQGKLQTHRIANRYWIKPVDLVRFIESQRGKIHPNKKPYARKTRVTDSRARDKGDKA